MAPRQRQCAHDDEGHDERQGRTQPQLEGLHLVAMSGAIITLEASPISIGTKNIPVSGTKVSTAADTTPGSVWGSVTWRKARGGDAPSGLFERNIYY